MSQENPNTNGAQTNGAQFKNDLEVLSDLLKDGAEVNENDGASVAALIQRLEGANGVAEGMEGKLDDLLSNLDVLLESMESSKPAEKESHESVRPSLHKSQRTHLLALSKPQLMHTISRLCIISPYRSVLE